MRGQGESWAWGRQVRPQPCMGQALELDWLPLALPAGMAGWHPTSQDLTSFKTRSLWPTSGGSALTSRPQAGQAGRAQAAHGTPGHPVPRSPPGRTGSARSARCPWPPRRAAAGPPHLGSGGQCGRGRSEGWGSGRGRGLGGTAQTEGITWSSRRLGKNTFLRNCREGSSGGREAGVTAGAGAQPGPPSSPSPGSGWAEDPEVGQGTGQEVALTHGHVVIRCVGEAQQELWPLAA